MVAGRCIMQACIFLSGQSDIILWFALLTTLYLSFSKKFANIKFAQIFNCICFSYGNYEIQNQNLLILRQNLILMALQVCMAKKVMFTFDFDTHHDYNLWMC